MIPDSLERKQNYDDELGIIAVTILALVLIVITVVTLTQPLEEKPTGEHVEVEE